MRRMGRPYIVIFLALLLASALIFVASAADIEVQWKVSEAGGLAQADQETPSPEVATPGGDLPVDFSVELVQVTDGLIDPINVVSPPDDTGRLFVVE